MVTPTHPTSNVFRDHGAATYYEDVISSVARFRIVPGERPDAFRAEIKERLRAAETAAIAGGMPVDAVGLATSLMVAFADGALGLVSPGPGLRAELYEGRAPALHRLADTLARIESLPPGEGGAGLAELYRTCRALGFRSAEERDGPQVEDKGIPGLTADAPGAMGGTPRERTPFRASPAPAPGAGLGVLLGSCGAAAVLYVVFRLTLTVYAADFARILP